MNKCSKIKLSFKGKALVVNQLLHAGLWHLAFIIPLPPEQLIKQLENAVQNYLWDNKNIKTRKNVSKLSIKKGGLKIISIKEKLKSIQTSWIAKFFISELSGPWRDAAELVLNEYRKAEQGNLVFLTSHSNASLKTLPPYYRQMFKN